MEIIIIAERIEPIPNFEIKLPIGNYLFAGCKGVPRWINLNLQKIADGGPEQFKHIYIKWLDSSKRKRVNKRETRRLKKL